MPAAISATVPISRPNSAAEAGGASAPAAPSETERLVAARITADGVMEHVRMLASAPRDGGSSAYRAQAQYVLEQARRAGFDARIVEHSDWRGTSYNVIADRTGTAPDSTRKLVLAGAHLDSVPRGPGANDNASGSGLLLEVAEALQGVETPNDVRLLWFDREEQGLVGSAAYARDYQKSLEPAVVMLNADMVASPKGDVGFSVGPRTSSAVGDAIKGVALRNGIDAAFRDERHARSDHASFDRIGIPAVDFGVSVRTVDRDDPNYHTPRDTPDKLNTQVLEGYADLFALSVLDWGARTERITEPAAPRPARPITGPPL